MKINLKKCAFVLALAIGAFMGTQNVHAATLNYDFSGIWYERFDGNGNNYSSWKLENYYVDGNVAYCIEPGIPEGNPMYEGTWANTGLSDAIKERVTLIGYYGYTYPGHQTQKYRAATQGMIWATILGNNTTVNFTTERYGAGDRYDVSAERAEIERLIATHYTRPSFNGGTYTLQVGETLTLTDTNGVLGNYSVSVSGANYNVDGNNLTITPTTSGNITITLKKNMPYSSGYRIFYGDGIQNMLVPGTTDPVVSQIKVNAYYGQVEMNKLDIETGNKVQGQATLKGAVYGVYKTDGTLITKITTDENGYAKSDAVLSYGSYYLQEITASNGYHVNNEKIFFDIKGRDLVKTDNSKETVVKNYISILKQYDYVNGTTQFLNAESGITFEIFYPNGDKYGEITTDKNGYATLEIPYGVWKFHQVNTTTGYEKIYDFYITVDYNSAKEQYYNILNNALSAYLQITKVDSETGKTIELADTTFKIYNNDTKQYVSQYVGGKVISEFKTDEKGIVITPLKLSSGNYKIVEVKSPSGYLINENGLDFTIGNDTHFNYTTYGAFVVSTFKDTAIKGQIEVNKYGESFVVNDGTYKYEKISLSGIEFTIFAEEDILSSDGNYLFYNKGDKVETIKTNKDGYAISSKLPLGKYYIVETKTLENYILNTEKYSFELTEIDNKTPIVYKSYSDLNKYKKGTIDFTKTDLVDGQVIPNTKIEIYNEKDKLVFSGITDKDGKITITDLPVNTKFYIIETEPATGYVITDEKVYFTITENGEIVKAEMKNKPITSKLEFTKSDISTDETLPNTLIEIYNEKDELVFSGRTDKDGKIVIEELRYGKYYIIEKDAPEGYILNTEKMYFEVKEDGAIIKSNMKDKAITSTLEFTKSDISTDETLPNTLIEIYNEKDELVFSGRTDKDGKIVIEELRYGKYYIIEKDAPEGYVLNDEKMYFEVKEDGEIIKSNMKDKKITSTLVFTKTDVSTSEPLPNTLIEIYNEKDELVFSGRTDENGQVIIEELEYGKYYILEKEAPKGYTLNEEKMYFEVKEDGEIIKCTMTDDKIVEVPNTNKNDTLALGMITLISLGAGCVIYGTIKNKKRKK